MPGTVVDLADLRRADRWNAEFHLATRGDRPASAFPLVRLADLVDERREFLDPQQHPEHRFRYVGLEHVRPACGDLVASPLRPGHAIRSRSKVFRAGDILFGRLRPILNKVLLVSDDVGDGICSGEFHVLVPHRDRIDPVYLRTVLASTYVTNRTPDLQTGSALPRVRLADLLALDVPLPPPAVQRRIVDVVEQAAADRRHLRVRLEHGYDGLERALTELLERGRELPDYEELAGTSSAELAAAPGLPRAYEGLARIMHESNRPAGDPVT